MKKSAPKVRLKFEDGRNVPAELAVHKQGRKYFVATDTGEVQVFTAATLSNRRLKFEDGREVPAELAVRQQGSKYFVTTDTGEVKVFTANTLSKQRLKFKDGRDVPAELAVRQQGRNYFVTTDTGEVQVFTANALSKQRLKFENGREVPAELVVRKQGSKYFVTTDTGEVQVFTTATLSHRRLKFAEGREVPAAPIAHEQEGLTIDFLESTFSVDTPRAGISQKYLGTRAAPLPQRDSTTSSVRSMPGSARLLFIPLHEGQAPLHPLRIASLPFNVEGRTNIQMTLHTSNPHLTSQDKPIFIFVGRQKNAYIPCIEERSQSNVRVILVGPKGDFEALKGYIQPGVDFLVIERLSSATHGTYEHLGLLNARRIAAFSCALLLKQRYHIPHAIMSDDNLQSIYFLSEQGVDSTWEACFSELALQLNKEPSVCVSVATLSPHVERSKRAGLLGSKIYMFDLERLHGPLGHEESLWFLPFFPANANAFWGEDYYFQLMFQAMFSGQCKGYRILPPENYGIQRASLPALCKKVVRTADALCKTSIDELFPDNESIQLEQLQKPGFTPRQYIEQSVATLRAIIHDNIEIYQALLNRSRYTSLMLAHAWANRLAFKSTARAALIDDTLFLSALEQHIGLIKDHGHLYPYQREILTTVCDHLRANRFIGQLNMATGTGKTYIQIYLAIAALLTESTRPIIIVTPYRQLVKQAYNDFIGILQGFPDLPIQAAQILKMDSDTLSLSAETLMQNRTLDTEACVLIACKDSYTKVLESSDVSMRRYQQPCMLLVDESHMQSILLRQWSELNTNPRHCFVATLSATPKRGQRRLFTEDEFVIEYSREEAVAQGHLTPCILDRFNGDFSHQNVMAIIQQMPDVLSRTISPSGEALVDKKGIIYVPNSTSSMNYSRQLKMILDAANIPCFEINSNEPESQDNLEAYKDYKAHPSPTKILICKGMAKIGFSDKETSWIIYLQKGSAAEFCQSAGRAMRVLNNLKIAYVLAFNNVQSGLVFTTPEVTADRAALERASRNYFVQRQVTQGIMAIRQGHEDDSLTLPFKKRGQENLIAPFGPSGTEYMMMDRHVGDSRSRHGFFAKDHQVNVSQEENTSQLSEMGSLPIPKCA